VAPTVIGWTLGGRRETVTDANGRKTRWTYNSFGQQVSVTYNWGGADEDTYSYTYTDGRLDTITHPMGDTIQHVYDAGGRLVEMVRRRARRAWWVRTGWSSPTTIWTG